MVLENIALETTPPEEIETENEVGEIDENELMDILKEVLPPEELAKLSLKEVPDLLKVLNAATAKNNLDPRKILDDVFQQESQDNIGSK